jgi:hypothetical protein
MALVRPLDLDFLGPPLFRCESPVNEGWKSLGFLGFSRPNRASMTYEGVSAKVFSSPSPVSSAASQSAGWRLSTRRLTLSSRRCRVTVFRHHRLLMLVEPVDHLDERGDRLELSAPDRLADDTQGGHQAFELQVRVVDAAVDDPLARELPRRSGEPAPALTRSSPAISS